MAQNKRLSLSSQCWSGTILEMLLQEPCSRAQQALGHSNLSAQWCGISAALNIAGILPEALVASVNMYLCTFPRIALLKTTTYIRKYDKILLTLLSPYSFVNHSPPTHRSFLVFFFPFISSFFLPSLISHKSFFLSIYFFSTVSHPHLLLPHHKDRLSHLWQAEETPDHFLQYVVHSQPH